MMSRKKRRFARVRPYVNEKALNYLLNNHNHNTTHSILESQHPQDNHFLFSSATASLKWLLKILKTKKRRPLKVGLQAFTCPVVFQAIIESENSPVIFDITPQYFTTLQNNIDFKKLDILILTHLFGIPNPDYFEISRICKDKNIFLIDDLALTFRSSVSGEEVGKASDAAFYSFGFDKPVSCYRGGLLRINNEEYVDELESEFCKLEEEPYERQHSDLIKLSLFYVLFDPEFYILGSSFKTEDCTAKVIHHLCRNFKSFYRAGLSIINGFRRLNKHTPYKFVQSTSRIPVTKMGQLKCTYLKTLWGRYAYVHNERLSAANKCMTKISSFFGTLLAPILPTHIEPSWHRLPLLVPESKRLAIIQWGKINGIEIGTFNWKALCFEPFQWSGNLSHNKFPYSDRVRRQILNLPIWSEEIWEVGPTNPDGKKDKISRVVQ